VVAKIVAGDKHIIVVIERLRDGMVIVRLNAVS